MPPRKSTKKEKSALLSALQFVAQAAKAEGEPFETHISLNSDQASFTNRIFTLSAPISEDITAAPRAVPFLKALERVGPKFSLTIAPGSVVIAGGGLRFTVPSMEALPTPAPDPIQGPLTASFALGVKTVFPATKGRFPIIEIGPGTMLATNGMILIEYYHGLSLPSLCIPCELAELEFVPTGIGLGSHSLTLHDDAGRWIRSSLPVLSIPEKARSLFDHPHNAEPIPTGLWEGIASIQDFSEDGFIRFKDGELWTHAVKEKGATVRVEGVRKGINYAVENLSVIKSIAHSADFSADRCFFYGENIRGIMMGDKRV